MQVGCHRGRLETGSYLSFEGSGIVPCANLIREFLMMMMAKVIMMITVIMMIAVMVTVMTMVERRVMMTLKTVAFLLTGSVSFIVRTLKFAGF